MAARSPQPAARSRGSETFGTAKAIMVGCGGEAPRIQRTRGSPDRSSRVGTRTGFEAAPRRGGLGPARRHGLGGGRGAARAGGAQPASAYGLSLEVCASGASCGASQGQRSRTLPFGSVRAETQCDYSGIWVRDGGRGRRLTVRLCRLQSCRLRGAAAGAWTTVPPSGIQLVWANAQMLEDSSLSPSESWIVRAVRKSLKSDL